MVVRMELRRKQSTERTSLRQTLRELRDELGISQADLARELGTSQPAVLKTESSQDPRLSTIQRYVRGLGNVTGQTAEVSVIAEIGGRAAVVDMPQSSDADIEPAGAGERTMTDDASRPRALQTAWRLRAWDDPVLEAAWLEQGVISMSADEIGDLTSWPGDGAVGDLLSAALPDRSPQAIGTFVTYWRYFRREMAVGDIVVTPMSGRRAGTARITGEYRYLPDQADPRLRHTRTVEWLSSGPRSELDDDIRKVVNAPGTLCRIGAPDAAERLS